MLLMLDNKVVRTFSHRIICAIFSSIRSNPTTVWCRPILDSTLSRSMLAHHQTETNTMSAIVNNRIQIRIADCWVKQRGKNSPENDGESIFFSFSVLFPVHLVDAICSSFTKWTLLVFGMCTDKWQCTLAHDGQRLAMPSKIETFVRPLQAKRNPVSAIWCGADRFVRSVYTIAFAKQLKMNFSIILFGDCVNARRTQLTPSTMRKRQCIQTGKKMRTKRGNERTHGKKWKRSERWL